MEFKNRELTVMLNETRQTLLLQGFIKDNNGEISNLLSVTISLIKSYDKSMLKLYEIVTEINDILKNINKYDLSLDDKICIKLKELLEEEKMKYEDF